MKKVNSRSREKMVWSWFGLLSVVVRRWPKAIGVRPRVHAAGVRHKLGLLWWYWGVQDEVSGLLSDPGLCGGGRLPAALSFPAAYLIGTSH